MWDILCGERTPRAGFPALNSTATDQTKSFSGSEGCWETENKSRFHYENVKAGRTPRSPMLITNIDSRRHNPHPELAQHIYDLVGKQRQVCTVRTLIPEQPPDYRTDSSNYQSSFRRNSSLPKRVLYNRTDFEKQANGIVPQNVLPMDDVKQEMILPVTIATDTHVFPSAASPHKYFTRKKKVSPCYKDSGVIYGTDREKSIIPVKTNSITHLSGLEFTRKKYVTPPPSAFDVKTFDGAAKPIKGRSELHPFMRARRII